MADNRNINTGGRRHNERIERDYIQGNVFENILNIIYGQKITPTGNPVRPKNERILLATVKEEVTKRLRQSLHNNVRINLGKELQPQQVKCPWDAEIKTGLKPFEPLPNTTTILEVFDSVEVTGKLLILGAPGAGKTTTQLELAQELIKRAEEQPDYPVPVLFNLSSWKDNRKSLTDWLVTELKSKYGVSNKLGKEWVDNKQLLPLLDGLDELDPQRQELCIHAINQFLADETRPFYLVVCSRSEEYSNYATQLQLNGAICLKPLSNNQIFQHLIDINCIELCSTISSDLDILELVRTPLLLSVTVLASQEISVKKWQELGSTVDRIQYLLDAYIGQMLTRNIENRAYLKKKTPNARKTRMWLVWLAQQLQREAKTEFLIEEMRPAWLNHKSQILEYKLIFSLIFWLFPTLLTYSGLGLWEIYSPDRRVFVFLFSWLIGGLVFGFLMSERDILDQKLKLVERINFMNFKKEKADQVVLALILGGMLMFVFWLDNQVIIGVIIWLILMLFLGLIRGEPVTIENKKIPNQGIRKSAFHAVLLGLTSWAILGLSFALILGLTSWAILGLSFALIILMFFGGTTCLQHFTLRLVLYFNGYIPWNYARFLDYCTERLFLQRVGGRYRFIHKLFQDHFAQMEFKRN